MTGAVCVVLIARSADAGVALSQSDSKSTCSDVEILVTSGEQAVRAGRTVDATRIYEQILELVPRHAAALRKLAWLNAATGAHARAVELLQRRVESSPEDARAHQDLALALLRLGRRREAVAALGRTIALSPNYAPGHCNLGLALEECGDFAGAAAELREALRLQPESGFIAYHLAAVVAQAGEVQPLSKECPRDYLIPLFDGYADRFDAHLVETLRYAGPQLLADIVEQAPVIERRPLPWDVLDLGCGTGMTGVPFRAAARTITGVDISSRMLEHAAQRKLPDGRPVYDKLMECELRSALCDANCRYDLILAADVFIYIGDLRDLFIAVSRALRPGGLFAFTIEVWNGPDDYRLLPTRRYAQSISYVVQLAREVNLEEAGRREAILRLGENLEPAPGMVFLLRRPAEPSEPSLA
jgi:predicted TPR repeat methyltransferase